MPHTRGQVTGFRTALAAGLVVCTYLATTPVHIPVLVHVYDKIQHVAAFATLALLADFSFPRSAFDRRKIAALLAYGVLIEVWQYFLPYRSAEVLDVAADAVGLILYAVCVPAARLVPLLRDRWTAETPRS